MVFLPPDVPEVDAGKAASRLRALFLKRLGFPEHRPEGPLNVPHRIHRYFFDRGRLIPVLMRHDDGEIAGSQQGNGHRDNSLYALDPPVKRELAHHGHRLVRRGRLAGGLEDGDGDGQVEIRSLLLEARRGKVDYEILGRKIIAGIFQRRADPLPRLPDGRIGEPHDCETGKPPHDIHLHLDRVRLNPLKSHRDSPGKHLFPRMHGRMPPVAEPRRVSAFRSLIRAGVKKLKN
jgi:hypothetical protein